MFKDVIIFSWGYEVIKLREMGEKSKIYKSHYKVCNGL